ncbi:hypothetical protein [Acinetobacter vivianii]|uniref:hypothetical protein n=1 Tax=Acinetobacter vivianii TaxID=1776742 RepID=UPI00051845C6|nr:hypothetical protein [Acinetobacter vivianii]
MQKVMFCLAFTIIVELEILHMMVSRALMFCHSWLIFAGVIVACSAIFTVVIAAEGVINSYHSLPDPM